MAWGTRSRKWRAVVATTMILLAPSAFAKEPEVRAAESPTNDLLAEKISLGNQYLKSGLPGKAAEAFLAALDIDPENADVYARLGWAYLEAEDYEMAVKTYRRYVDLKPDDCASHQSLGFAYMRQELTDQAIVSYEKALALCPDDANAYMSLANAYRQGGYGLEAIEAYRRAIELNPQDVLAYETLANLYYERKLYPQAISAYEAILALPDNGKDAGWQAWAAKRLALMYKWAKSCEKAIPYYKMALEADPSDDRLTRSLAICYEETGAIGDAIRMYSALVEQLPEKPVYYYRLGELLVDVGRYQQALRIVKQGKNYDTECPAHAHAVIGRALEKLGGVTNYKKAEREFRKCTDCGDKNFNSYCEQQIERQQLLAKRAELQKQKEDQGF